MASEQAIRSLQSTLPPVRKQAPLEVENVQPNLLLAPNNAGNPPPPSVPERPCRKLKGQGQGVGELLVGRGEGVSPPHHRLLSNQGQ